MEKTKLIRDNNLAKLHETQDVHPFFSTFVIIINLLFNKKIGKGLPADSF